MTLTITPSVALVLPGEAMWGAFQTGAAFELGTQLQDLGFPEQPFDVAIGSSSGSLIATAAASGRFDHDQAVQSWVQFGEMTRLSGQPYKLNPYPTAFTKLLEGDFFNLDAAQKSRTHLILTATHYQGDALADLFKHHLDMLITSAKLIITGNAISDASELHEIGARLLADGNRLFSTRYFSNKHDFDFQHPESPLNEQWIHVDSAAALKSAVTASARIPLLYGNPLVDGPHVLIDGAFSNNAPVRLALATGAKHVFVITSSQKGYVFDRPFQSLFRVRLRALLKFFESASKALPFSSQLKILQMLNEVAHLSAHIPDTAPLNLGALKRQHPDQQVHIIHPTRHMRVNRFFETDKKVLEQLYRMGIQAIKDLGLVSGD